jgi:hypothetical protein
MKESFALNQSVAGSAPKADTLGRRLSKQLSLQVFV